MIKQYEQSDKMNSIKWLNNLTKNDIVVHISHIDLDGYGATYIVKKYIEKSVLTLIQDNTNYGKIISKLKKLNVQHNIKVLITDLNLTLDECVELDNMCDSWCVIDHHVTGNASADKYPNYYLSTSKCATMLTNNLLYLSKLESNVSNNTSDSLNDIADLINTYDLWNKSDLVKFRKGIFVSDLIYNMPFEIKQLRYEYVNFIFETIIPFILENGVRESSIHYNRLFMFWLNNLYDLEFLRDDTIPNLVKTALLHVKYIDTKLVHETEEYNIYSNISSKVTQYLFDEMFTMEKYKNKILINLDEKKGGVAFRSCNEKANILAVKAGGGGHPNAGGAKLKYEELQDKTFLDVLIEKLS